ncbi:hypothetical protein PFISCL1PPCAC_25046, partial [Pristionchus fissidentatus]
SFMSSTHSCLVCSATISETHLGINACRACALFYKRTRRTRRAYTCRRGTGKCVFKKHEPFACKKCRFDRCLAIGMENGSEEREEMTILERVKTEYDLLLKRRLAEEKRLVVLHNPPRIENVTQELYKTSAFYYYDTYPVMMRGLIAMLNVVLPEFDEFSDEIKFSILKNLFGKFYAVDSYFRTSRSYLKTGKCVCTMLSCFDINACDQWWNEHEENERKADLQLSLKTHARDYLDILYKMLRTDDITEREFHALIVIIFCELDTTIHLPDRIQSLFDSLRSRVLQELQDYYKTRLQLQDYSTRLGTLMSLTAAISEIHVTASEQLRLYSFLFDIKSEDEMLNEVIAAQSNHSTPLKVNPE